MERVAHGRSRDLGVTPAHLLTVEGHHRILTGRGAAALEFTAGAESRSGTEVVAVRHTLLVAHEAAG